MQDKRDRKKFAEDIKQYEEKNDSTCNFSSFDSERQSDSPSGFDKQWSSKSLPDMNVKLVQKTILDLSTKINNLKNRDQFLTKLIEEKDALLSEQNAELSKVKTEIEAKKKELHDYQNDIARSLASQVHTEEVLQNSQQIITDKSPSHLFLQECLEASDSENSSDRNIKGVDITFQGLVKEEAAKGSLFVKLWENFCAGWERFKGFLKGVKDSLVENLYKAFKVLKDWLKETGQSFAKLALETAPQKVQDVFKAVSQFCQSCLAPQEEKICLNRSL